jgi:hypothetical protein
MAAFATAVYKTATDECVFLLPDWPIVRFAGKF